MWSSGDPVLLRYVHGGRVSRVLPMTVVEDAGDRTALFVPSGTRTMTRCGPDGRPIPRELPYAKRFSLPWTLCEGIWEGAEMVMLVPDAAPFGIWAVFVEGWRLREWYVNLQEPLRRTPFGFDTADNVLDIVIEPDLSAWRWKDEHELAEAVRLGRFSAGEAEEVREQGRRAIETLQTRGWPFDRDWGAWRPDPAWARPRLPDELSAYVDVSEA